jgi:hypothetical protein
MAIRDFGAKGIRLSNGNVAPQITSPISLDIKATQVAISTDLTVGRDLDVTGISTLGGVQLSSGTVQSSTGVAVTFIGNLTGTATTATNLAGGAAGSVPYQTDDGVTTFVGAGGTDEALVYNGTQPVWQKIGLGTNTTGNYVKELTGTAGEIVLSSPTNEPGATHQVGLATNVTVQGNLRIEGNLSIGGTASNINVQDLFVQNKDIVLGVTTDINDVDISTDATANGGGIAIASTEGTALVNLNSGLYETLPSTYKKIMWFGAAGGPGGTAFPNLAVDAWLSNYAFGVGTTSMSAGTVFAAGNVEISNDDITTVRNINATGISTLGGIQISSGTVQSSTGTAATFTGNLTGTATTATNLAGGAQGSVPYQSGDGATTFVGAASSNNQVLLYDTTSGNPYWGNVSSASGSFGGITVKEEGTTVGDVDSITTLNVVGTNLTVTATTGASGIATITMSDNIVGTGLSISGSIGVGTTTPSEKLQVQGNISINGNTSYGAISTSTSTVSQTAIYSGLSASDYRSVEFTIQATEGSNYHVTKVLSIHDGSIVYNSEYGILYTNESVSEFDVDISSGNLRLLATATSASLTTYTVNFIATKI